MSDEIEAMRRRLQDMEFENKRLHKERLELSETSERYRKEANRANASEKEARKAARAAYQALESTEHLLAGIEKHLREMAECRKAKEARRLAATMLDAIHDARLKAEDRVVRAHQERILWTIWQNLPPGTTEHRMMGEFFSEHAADLVDRDIRNAVAQHFGS